MSVRIEYLPAKLRDCVLSELLLYDDTFSSTAALGADPSPAAECRKYGSHTTMNPSGTSTVPHRIFISYARADASEFAVRLAGSLRESGYEIWIDLEGIHPGQTFDTRIEDGIRSAHTILAIMTPSSVREQSICRDEIVFSLNCEKTVVPLKAHPTVAPPLLLARRNWLDFSLDYPSALKKLLEYLRGTVAALLLPRLPTITYISPLDFSEDIARHSVGYVGREWLENKVEQWMTGSEAPLLLLVGEPGIGKSTIAARLINTRPDVVAAHFCSQSNVRSLDAQEFVASIVGQLQAQIPGFAEVVEDMKPGLRRENASIAFQELVQLPCARVPAPLKRKLVIIDGLDESLARSTEILNIIMTNVGLTPWLRFLVTTRPVSSILEKIGSAIIIEIDPLGPENRHDIEKFVTNRLARALNPDGRGTARQLIEASDGNFLHAKLVLDSIEGEMRPSMSLGKLPGGLSEFHRRMFDRQFPDIEGFHRNHATLLSILCVAQGPLPEPILLDTLDIPATEFEERLKQLRVFLEVRSSVGSKTYTLFHRTIAEWLMDRQASGPYWCDPDKGHEALQSTLRSLSYRSDYGLRYLILHLLATGQANAAADELLNPKFVEAKAGAGYIYELSAEFDIVARRLDANDFRRELLTRLFEAVQTDLRFLADHPTLLFQCLWNRCWWYDCEEARHHYIDLEKGWMSHGQGTPLAKPILSVFMESWRRDKEIQEPRLTWVRSLRPPVSRLGSTLRGVMTGAGPGTDHFAVSRDNRLVSSSSDGIRVWDINTARLLINFPGSDFKAEAVTFTPDGHHIVSGGGPMDATIRIWNSSTGEQVGACHGHSYIVNSIVVSGDGRKIVSGSWDKTVRVWDFDTCRELLRLEHRDVVASVSISPDGKRIASTGWDQTVRLWDGDSGEELRRFGPEKRLQKWQHLKSVRFSPNGRYVASGGDDREIRVWDVDSGAKVIVIGDLIANVQSVRFSPDGTKILAGCYDGTARVWDLNGVEMACHDGHEGGVMCVDTTVNGQSLLSVDEHNTIRVWALESAPRTHRLIDHESGVSVVEFSPDGRLLASGCWDGSIFLWTATTGRLEFALNGQEPSEFGVTGLAFSPDGTRLISAGDDGAVRFWDLTERKEVALLRIARNRMCCVAVSPNGNLVAAGTFHGKILVWNYQTRKRVFRIDCCKSGWVDSIAFSLDGTKLLSGEFQVVKVWDCSTGRLVRSFQLPDEADEMCSDAVLTADNKHLVVRTARKIYIWDIARGILLTEHPEVGDIRVIGISHERFPFHLDQNDLETSVKDVRTGRTIAWYPEIPWMSKVSAHPSGRIWASAKATNHVYLFTLEGGAT